MSVPHKYEYTASAQPDAIAIIDSYIYRAEHEFDRNDRRIFAGFAGSIAGSDIELGTVDPTQAQQISHAVNAFGAMVVNKRFDALTLPTAKLTISPTPTDIQAGRKAEQARALRHSQGRSISLAGLPEMRTFPSNLINRYTHEFYSTVAGNPLHKDPVIRKKFMNQLYRAQKAVFVEAVAPVDQAEESQAEESNERSIKLSPAAEVYPQIAITARLLVLFRSLDLPVEATASEVLIASFGRRLASLGHAVGVAAVHPRGHMAVSEDGRDNHNIFHF